MHSPDEIFSAASVRCFFVMEPITRQTDIPIGSSISERVEKCCAARISVGAIRAVWKPFFAANKAAAAATAVFPEPTSPCKSLFMGDVPCISAIMSFTARFWAFVISKGSDFPKAAMSSFRGDILQAFSVRVRFFISIIPNCSRSSSSKASRLRATSAAWESLGKCMLFSAYSRVEREYSSLTPSGRESAKKLSSALFKISETLVVTIAAVSPSVRG